MNKLVNLFTNKYLLAVIGFLFVLSFIARFARR